MIVREKKRKITFMMLKKIVINVIYYVIFFRTIIRNFVLEILDVGFMKQVKNKDNVYDINYYHHNKLWTIRVVDEGARPAIIKIIDEKEKNVYKDVDRFIGPFKNFHSTKISPNLLSHDTLEFKMIGKNKIFSKDETITLE